MSEEKCVVEVIYAYPDRYFLKKVTLSAPTTVQNVILKNKVGIFSRSVKLTDMVNDGDRIEIYRPLIADPKEIRRQRAQEQAAKSK